MVSSKVHSKDVYRLFLQGVLSRRVMSERVAKALFKACVDAVGNADATKRQDIDAFDHEWDTLLNKIKEDLDPLGLDFAHTKDEESGVTVWALVNIIPDDPAQVASDYNPNEIALLKAIVEQIMFSQRYAYSISSMAALREVTMLKKPAHMTKTQGELVLTTFVARGWLLKSSRGRYSLGPRALLELATYLREEYEDRCLECVICHDLVTKGSRCATPNCKTYLHKHCLERYRRREKCPSCQTPWVEGQAGLSPIGEGAVSDGTKEVRIMRRRDDAEDEEEEEEEEENYEEEEVADAQSQSQSQSQTQTRSQRSQSQAMTQMDRVQTRTKSGKGKQPAASQRVNGKRKKKAIAEESEEEIPDDLYADDTVDIDDMTQIRAEPTQRSRRR